MTRLEKLIDTIARLNPDAGEIGPGMLANIVQEARAIQAQGTPRYRYSLGVDGWMRQDINGPWVRYEDVKC